MGLIDLLRTDPDLETRLGVDRAKSLRGEIIRGAIEEALSGIERKTPITSSAGQDIRKLLLLGATEPDGLDRENPDFATIYRQYVADNRARVDAAIQLLEPYRRAAGIRL